MNPLFRIEVPRRAPACGNCKKILVVGDSYYSVLSLQEKDFPVRIDYCQECWQEHLGKNALGSWKGKVPPKNEKRKTVDRNAKALELLKASLKKEALADQEEAFVLSLYLARNRQIALRKELSSNTSLYEILATEEMLVVPKLKLSTLEIDKIQERLAKKFSED